MVIKSSITQNTPTELPNLDRALRLALKAQLNRERSNTRDQEHLHNENKNRGLINTIVNHSKKTKTIEKKFNLIINNFANSTHVKEVVNKMKEIEKHVFGTPRPHSSWREFLLVAIVVGVIGVLLIKVVKKFIAPEIVKCISKRITDKSSRPITISGNIPPNYHNNSKSRQEQKSNLEQRIHDQCEKLNELIYVLNMKRDKGIQPVHNEQPIMQ